MVIYWTFLSFNGKLAVISRQTSLFNGKLVVIKQKTCCHSMEDLFLFNGRFSDLMETLVNFEYLNLQKCFSYGQLLLPDFSLTCVMCSLFKQVCQCTLSISFLDVFCFRFSFDLLWSICHFRSTNCD